MIFFLFGWGKTTRKILDHGTTSICKHCHAEHLFKTKVTTWFTIFFAPIIPYRTKYFLLCPNCDYGFELLNKQENKFK